MHRPTTTAIYPSALHTPDIYPVVYTHRGRGLVVRRPEPAVARPPAWVSGWRPKVPLGPCQTPIQLVAVFDESGSVTSSSDPISYRHALFAQVLAKSASPCDCRTCSAGLVTFDVSASAAPVALTQRTVKALAQTMSALPSTSSTLSSALSWAEAAAKAAGNSHPITVVFSDFEIFDDASQRVYERLAALPGTTLAIVLRSGPPARLAQLGIETIHVPVDADRTVIADKLATVISQARSLLRP
jgi:hypothetical protein